MDLYALLDEIIPQDTEEQEEKPQKTAKTRKEKSPKKRANDFPMLDVSAYLSEWGGEWRIKEKGAVTWYQFRECPLHTDDDGDEWECAICQFTDGKMGAKCMHEPSFGWQDFKKVLGDPKPFYQSYTPAPTEPPIPIHLTDIERKEYEEKLVYTEVLLPGIGRDDSYFVPIVVEAGCLKDNKSKCSGCILESQDVIVKEFQGIDRNLINFIKQTDAQVYAGIRRALGVCKESTLTIEEKAEMQVLLAMPKAGAELRKTGGKLVDEHGRDFREKIIYYTGVVPRSNTYYQVTGKVISDPRSQRATMLVEDLIKLQSEYEKFEINNETKELLKAFQPENDSLAAIEKKVSELSTDIAYNIAGYFGDPRVNIVIADMLTWHSVLQFDFDGNPLPRGWIDTMIFGDSGINKTEHLRMLRNAIGFGHFVDAGAVSRAGLLYSLDDILSGIRILRWGALPLNDGQLVVIDEAQNIHIDVLTEMSSARTTGVLVVTKAKQGEHPMRTRQIYTANPKNPNTMAVSVASWLVSTDESFENVIVKPEHASWVELYLCRIYSAQPAMLDRHALVAGKTERTSDIELTEILAEWNKLNSPEPAHLAEMVILIAESEGIERDVLAAQIGIEPQTISRLVQRFKKHRFVKSTRKGYYATPRLVEFYRSKQDELEAIITGEQ